jgi:hypothetical protein
LLVFLLFTPAPLRRSGLNESVGRRTGEVKNGRSGTRRRDRLRCGYWILKDRRPNCSYEQILIEMISDLSEEFHSQSVLGRGDVGTGVGDGDECDALSRGTNNRVVESVGSGVELSDLGARTNLPRDSGTDSKVPGDSTGTASAFRFFFFFFFGGDVLSGVESCSGKDNENMTNEDQWLIITGLTPTNLRAVNGSEI